MGPIAAGMALGGSGLGGEGLLRREAGYSPNSPSPAEKATTRRAVPACGRWDERSTLPKIVWVSEFN